MRRWMLAPIGLLGAACSPEIGPGTYFCGPDAFCPPEQVCDGESFTCENPLLASEFACPAAPADVEPDNAPSEALELGDVQCGATLFGGDWGCIENGDDVDHFAFVHQAPCTGSAPHLQIELRHPVAFVPLGVALLDDSGEILAEGEHCTPGLDFSGTNSLCIDVPSLEPGEYVVRVRAAEGGSDCDGACRHNRYILDVRYPLG